MPTEPMSEIVICKRCGKPVLGQHICTIDVPPAEPVIEVAPGEPAVCQDCGDCLTCDCLCHRVFPAVPAQEAPREQTYRIAEDYGFTRQDVDEIKAAEPQADAQVPSQDEIGSILVAAIDRHITDESLRDLAVIAANGIYWRNQRIGKLETHLNTIKSYAVEAAKTPITREDMHDHLKAQTFFDEAKGFERLVLSEIGGGK